MLSRNWRTRYGVNCLRGHNLRDRTRRDHTHISPATAHTKPANRGLFFVRYFRVKHATARRPRSILNVPTAVAQLPPRPDPMPAVRDPRTAYPVPSIFFIVRVPSDIGSSCGVREEKIFIQCSGRTLSALVHGPCFSQIIM